MSSMSMFTHNRQHYNTFRFDNRYGEWENHLDPLEGEFPTIYHDTMIVNVFPEEVMFTLDSAQPGSQFVYLGMGEPQDVYKEMKGEVWLRGLTLLENWCAVILASPPLPVMEFPILMEAERFDRILHQVVQLGGVAITMHDETIAAQTMFEEFASISDTEYAPRENEIVERVNKLYGYDD